MAFEQERRANVYRLYDSEGTLLYVGMGMSVADRVYNHKKYQPWGDQIARVEADPETDWYAAWEQETIQIRSLNPKYNKDKRGAKPPGREVTIRLKASTYWEFRQLVVDRDSSMQQIISDAVDRKLSERSL